MKSAPRSRSASGWHCAGHCSKKAETSPHPRSCSISRRPPASGYRYNDAQQQIRDDWAEGDRRGVIGSPHFFVGRDGYFCPTLKISRTDDQLSITDNSPAFEAFVGHALGQ